MFIAANSNRILFLSTILIGILSKEYFKGFLYITIAVLIILFFLYISHIKTNKIIKEIGTTQAKAAYDSAFGMGAFSRGENFKGFAIFITLYFFSLIIYSSIMLVKMFF